MELHEILRKVRETKPTVQCITNFVTVNDCANVLLAAGGAPTMAMDIREVEEVAEQVEAVVCNLGAIEHFESMILAGKRANACGRPVVLDPVAAGGRTLRRESAIRLLREVKMTAIRGNASEIRALALGSRSGNGVEVSSTDRVSADNQENLRMTVRMAETFAKAIQSVVVVSGAIDIITDGTQTVLIHNGVPTMARFTGSGCMLTTLIGAFCGAAPEQPLEATCAAVAVMGICGELAEQRRLKNGTGNATFRIDLIDAVFNLTEEQCKEMIRYEIYKG